jgi:hypothetical protein
MARARNIKPAFFQNELLAELTPLARLAFIGMWTIADFKGCIEFRPKRLKVQLLPYDDCDMETIAINLEQSGFILIYSVAGQRYIKIPKFEQHQNPHKNERDAGSAIPDHDKSDIKINKLTQDGTKPDKIGSDRADSLLLIPDSFNLIPDTGNLMPLVPSGKKPVVQKTEIETELQNACKQTWQSYCDAYFDRYKTEPVRNAKVNGQIKSFVKRLGYEDAPHVAASYVQSSNSYYVQRGHSCDGLLADAEKHRTEWATGRRMTTTRAAQMDKTQANFSAVGEAMEILANGGI